MKVSSTELPPRQVSLDIEVEQERLDRAVDDAFRRLAGRVDVPGFRRGKASYEAALNFLCGLCALCERGFLRAKDANSAKEFKSA